MAGRASRRDGSWDLHWNTCQWSKHKAQYAIGFQTVISVQHRFYMTRMVLWRAWLQLMWELQKMDLPRYDTASILIELYELIQQDVNCAIRMHADCLSWRLRWSALIAGKCVIARRCLALKGCCVCIAESTACVSYLTAIVVAVALTFSTMVRPLSLLFST